MAEDLALSGLEIERVEVDTSDDEDFEVLDENWESLSWFLKLSRRWVFSPMDNRRIRIDEQAVLAQFNIFNVSKAKRITIMDDLLAMEHAALEVLNRE